MAVTPALGIEDVLIDEGQSNTSSLTRGHRSRGRYRGSIALFYLDFGYNKIRGDITLIYFDSACNKTQREYHFVLF